MNKPIITNPAADLPTNWTEGQIVAPSGTDVGLDSKHGYNYLNQKINEALTDIGTLNNAFPIIPSISSFTVPDGWMRGDVNHDGKITQEDVDYIYDVVNGEREMPEEGSDLFKACDVNNDGQISLTDITACDQIAKGTIKPYVYPEITGHWKNDATKGFWEERDIQGFSLNDNLYIYEPTGITFIDEISKFYYPDVPYWFRFYCPLCPVNPITIYPFYFYSQGTSRVYIQHNN